jgi:RNA methyltransferase, TrmH family
MLTKNELKTYSSLNQKKFRNKENKFIAEGIKIVEEGLNSNLKCDIILTSNQYFEENQDYLQRIKKKGHRLEILKSQDFSRLIDTVNPQGIAAVFNKSVKYLNAADNLISKIVVCLENISDPGNLGTIIRNCDWFGIKDILLVNNCADLYNPKTVRASMGSIFHVRIYEDVQIEHLTELKKNNYNFLCADLNGENIYEYTPPAKSIIIFSNEASGPSQNIIELTDEKITIPKSGKAESLNVASASAVILSVFTQKLAFNL